SDGSGGGSKVNDVRGPGWGRRRALFAFLAVCVFVAGLAALVGLVPVLAGVWRVHLMAALLVPVLLSSSGF
ncbi:MAG: hypothetical protein AABX97_10055, partial [Candidatus Thermoplasmatota archaeon]